MDIWLGPPTSPTCVCTPLYLPSVCSEIYFINKRRGLSGGTSQREVLIQLYIYIYIYHCLVFHYIVAMSHINNMLVLILARLDLPGCLKSILLVPNAHMCVCNKTALTDHLYRSVSALYRSLYFGPK